MTLLDVEELTRYWIDHPPLHLTVAAYLAIGTGNGRRLPSDFSMAAPPGASARTHVGALLAELGPSFESENVHAGLAPVVLDFAELKRKVRLSD